MFNYISGREALFEHVASHPGMETELVKQVLKHCGVRSSLIRRKVISVLLHCEDSTGRHGRQIHEWLEQDSGMPLLDANTFDVLRRLADHGIVERTGRRRYRIACAMLDYLSEYIQSTRR